MIILGVDWGERRVGVAFASGRTAAPLEVLEIKSADEALDKIVAMVDRLRAERIVLGVPLDSEGRETAVAKLVREFGQKLATMVGCEVVFWNEALTSREAVGRLIAAGRGQKDRRELDAASAAVTLQDYLDSLDPFPKRDPAAPLWDLTGGPRD